MWHTCSMCKVNGPWSESWSWYGSEKLFEVRPNAIAKLCCDECRAEFEGSSQQRRVAAAAGACAKKRWPC